MKDKIEELIYNSEDKWDNIEAGKAAQSILDLQIKEIEGLKRDNVGAIKPSQFCNAVQLNNRAFNLGLDSVISLLKGEG